MLYSLPAQHKTSENEIVLTGHRNAIRNTNTPIGQDIAFLRNTFGTDIVNNEITSFINLPTIHITNEQHVLLSNLNIGDAALPYLSSYVIECLITSLATL